MRNPEKKQKIAGWMFIVCALIWLVTLWYKDKLPKPEFYSHLKLPPPTQTPTANKPFEIDTNAQKYELTPLYFYKLTGVVVSDSKADGITNIWHHSRWKDFINIRDLCVIWNPNVKSGAYQKINFTSDSWTCWFNWQDTKTAKLFEPTALSNNHLLTNDLLIKKELLSAQIGDVISATGMLVNYVNLKNGFRRNTSIKRTDQGQGACEVIYLTDFNVIAKAHPSLLAINKIAFWVMWLCLLEYFYFAFTVPYKTKK